MPTPKIKKPKGLPRRVYSTITERSDRTGRYRVKAYGREGDRLPALDRYAETAREAEAAALAMDTAPRLTVTMTDQTGDVVDIFTFRQLGSPGKRHTGRYCTTYVRRQVATIAAAIHAVTRTNAKGGTR